MACLSPGYMLFLISYLAAERPTFWGNLQVARFIEHLLINHLLTFYVGVRLVSEPGHVSSGF